jgi:cytochrome b6-f complex iron-sulfur subunit
MDRREFINWVGLFGISASLPIAIAACTSSPEEEQATAPEAASSEGTGTLEMAPREDGFIPVGSLTALQASQSGAIVPPEVAVVIVRNANDPAAPTAVNPKCTHTGCLVEWHTAVNSFVCPCHNAEFDPAGNVTQGPAEEPLQTYEVKVEGDSILVKLA